MNEWIKHRECWKRLNNRIIERRHFHLWKYLHSIFPLSMLLSFTVVVCFLLHKVGTNFYHFSFRVCCFCCTFWGAKTKGKKIINWHPLKADCLFGDFVSVCLYPFVWYLKMGLKMEINILTVGFIIRCCFLFFFNSFLQKKILQTIYLYFFSFLCLLFIWNNEFESGENFCLRWDSYLHLKRKVILSSIGKLSSL